MATNTYCGIDPGLAGAVAFINEAGAFVSVHDMPVLMTTTGRKMVDAARLADILNEQTPSFVLVERVGPRPGEGAVGGSRVRKQEVRSTVRGELRGGTESTDQSASQSAINRRRNRR